MQGSWVGIVNQRLRFTIFSCLKPDKDSSAHEGCQKEDVPKKCEDTSWTATLSFLIKITWLNTFWVFFSCRNRYLWLGGRLTHLDLQFTEINDCIGSCLTVMGDWAIFKAAINELPWISCSNRVSHVCDPYAHSIDVFVADTDTSNVFAPTGVVDWVWFTFIWGFSILLDLLKDLEVEASFGVSWVPSNFRWDGTFTVGHI